MREELKQRQVKQLIVSHRKLLPRLGTRKLYHLIKEELATRQIKFGRDKLFKLLGEAGLLIKPQRSYIQTTMSRHWMKKWPNLVKDKVIDRPDQVWVSDITYIKTEQGTCYLNMITDAYSRKIMGYAVDQTMETENMIKALEMAHIERLDKQTATIHHSDRGLQYCSREYVQLSRKNNIQLSMTENSDPYENALAERMNRTIKEEFGLNRRLKSRQQVYDLVKESVHLYNQIRPHLALGMRTPNEVYKQKIPTT
jgi:transposase InsO family protein